MRFGSSEVWTQTTIGKIAQVVGGGTPETDNSDYWNGKIQWFTPSEVGQTKYIEKSERTISVDGLNKSSAKLLPVGTLLLSTRATVGECSIALNECSTNQGFQSLIVSDKVNNEFLYYLIATKKRHFVKYACGSTFLEISNKEVAKTKIFLPQQWEQEKIATFLSKIDQRIETQSKIIEKLQSQMLAIYHQVFSQLKSEVLPLAKLCSLQKGTQVNGISLLENGPYYFMNGGIVPSGFYNEWNTETNTISISEGGNSCGYVQYNKERFWSGGHCYTLQNLNKVSVRYLYHFLKSHEKDIMRLRIGTGLPNIQKKDLEQFLIKVPSLLEQERLVQLLDSFELKIETEGNLFKKYKEQKKFLLSNMFI